MAKSRRHLRVDRVNEELERYARDFRDPLSSARLRKEIATRIILLLEEEDKQWQTLHAKK